MTTANSRPRLVLFSLAMALVLGLIPAAANAAPRTITADLLGTGELVEGGQAVLIPLIVSCPRGGYEVLEAHVSVSQGFANGMAGLALRCGGRERTYLVRVPTLGAAFTAGTANASAFILLLNGRTGGTLSGGDSGPITIQ